jgi:hypothetical protein
LRFWLPFMTWANTLCASRNAYVGKARAAAM